MVCYHVQVQHMFYNYTCIKIYTSLMSVCMLLIQTYRIHVLNKCGQIFSLQYIYWTSLNSGLSLFGMWPLTLSHSTMFSSFSLSADVSRIRRLVRWALWYRMKTSLFCTYFKTRSWKQKSKYLRVNTNKIAGIRIIYFFFHKKSLTM